MELIINLFVLLPIIGYFTSVCIPKRNEFLLSLIAFTSSGILFFLSIVFGSYWLISGAHSINIKEFSILRIGDYDFFIDLFFDGISMTYLILGSMLSFIITMYSRYYLHREEGYKRFFNVVSLFYLGYNIVILSGNFETMFIGWEFLGISSFLLIAFYRDRYLPVKNAVKVFSIYRIGDVGLILVMWLSHHLWHENVSFDKLQNYELVHEHIINHSVVGFIIALMIYISAIAKSAQLPFSSWLPRAMEGPTPSSAIFYGSLSVHIGAFLLLRTYSFWEQQTTFRILVFVMGIFTSVLAVLMARVQSSIKSQVAYSSISQIGLIFSEIALGMETVALIHIAGNAFIRTYQLLVSPSVVSYKMREQFYNYVPKLKTLEDSWPKRIEYSLYILSLKEWNLDSMMYRRLWNPLKRIGNTLSFLNFKNVYFFFGLLFIGGVILATYNTRLPVSWINNLPVFFSIVGLFLVIKAFTERESARLSWSLVIANHLSISLAISFNEHFSFSHHLWYLGGVVFAGLVGYGCIQRLRSLEKWVSLDKFYGHAYEHPKIALIFLLASLGVAGFPITPTFIGEDLIFSHIKENQVILALLISLSLIINGLASIRIYSRIFLGPHVKTYHDVAKRSS